MGKIIGIDLGTTNSCVSVFEGGEAKVIQNAEGKRTTPSIVAFTKDGKKVGDAAKRQAVTNPHFTINSIKRLMGITYKEAMEANLDEETAYKIVDSNGRPAVEIEENGEVKLYSPEEISAIILQKMKKTAEEYLGETVTEAVITVPAFFNDKQRQSTQDAGKIAGLEVKRIINEPTSAALAYGLDKSDEDKTIAVFDFGGGTHDISILELGDGVFEVLGTDGDTRLGGDDVDNKIIDYLADHFMKDFPSVDLRKDPLALQRLKEAAEKAKIELSSSSSTDINLPYITPVDNVPQHLNISLSKAVFENLISDIVKKTIDPCKSALEKAGKDKTEIDEIILVGGSTRIPVIQKAVEDFFGKEPSKGVNPDEVVSLGASIQGGVLTGEVNDVLLLDVIPISLGIETQGNMMTKMVESNTTVPTKKTEIFSTAVDNQPSVSIRVLQGERPQSASNNLIGEFELSNIPPAQRGVPQIEVTFDVDANSILTVTAKELGTGQVQNITINDSSSLSDEEIERMRTEAEANAADDKKFEEEAKKINEADSMIFQVESSLKEHGDKIKESTKESCEALLIDLKGAKDSKDVERITSIIEQLTPILQSFYQEIQEASQTDTPQDEGSNEPEASDVDFEEVD